MNKPLPIGVDNFKKLIDKGYYFVDKSLYIKELLDMQSEVTLITRPRRFGKTLNMSMLKYFFEKTEEDNTYLFKGLKIMNESQKYLDCMGKYPVISLSLKAAKQPTFGMAYDKIVEIISEEFNSHKEVLSADDLLEYEKEKFRNIMEGKGSISDYNTSLKFLAKSLEKYYKKKVIILIDEYDVPLENAFFEGFYKEMVDFIRSLFESALKSNESLDFAVVTGCLRISKESIFTGLNNLNVCSILDANYREFFGFTEDEVLSICKDYNITDKYADIKKWYDGYNFSGMEVYNPWSLMKYLNDLMLDKNKEPLSYWANTSSNSIVRTLIERADKTTKSEIESLMKGESITKELHLDVTYDDLYTTSDSLWNILLLTGYLKVTSYNNEIMCLKIPNKEVKYIFKNKIMGWFRENIAKKDLTKFFNSLINGDIESLEKEIRSLLVNTISFHDSYENFYHGFMVGILLNMKDYIIKSNRESGDGRGDIFITNPEEDTAIIIELKVADKLKDLDNKCKEALKQIDNKNYDTELIEEGYEKITKYGISFFKKKCRVFKKE